MPIDSEPTIPARITVYSVTELNRTVRQMIETGFALIWVEGEISNLARPASGHIYFTLKDADAQVRCAFFRNQLRGRRQELNNGQQIQVFGRATLYEARGDYQLVVQECREAGEGALQRKFEELKARLMAEGLFDSSRKRPLPALPHKIAVVTSDTGAAIRDILSTLARRFPAIPVVLAPTPVQGEGADLKIAAALHDAAEYSGAEVIILARGGGSLEDLWSFNEETVARAIAESPLPIVCGVGHETDFTIADMVADLRAATPTAAAEAVTPDRMKMSGSLTVISRQLLRAWQRQQEQRAYVVDKLSARLARPDHRLREKHLRLPLLYSRLKQAARNRLNTSRTHCKDAVNAFHRHDPKTGLKDLYHRYRLIYPRLHLALKRCLDPRRHRLQRISGELDAVSPLATLKRGYAIINKLPQKTLVTGSEMLNPGDELEITFGTGRALAVTQHIRKAEND